MRLNERDTPKLVFMAYPRVLFRCLKGGDRRLRTFSAHNNGGDAGSEFIVAISTHVVISRDPEAAILDTFDKE